MSLSTCPLCGWTTHEDLVHDCARARRDAMASLRTLVAHHDAKCDERHVMFELAGGASVHLEAMPSGGFELIAVVMPNVAMTVLHTALLLDAIADALGRMGLEKVAPQNGAWP